MAGRVVLHVGLPKTGTTFLQQALWANRERLRAADVHLVVATMRELFDAARDLSRGGAGDWRGLVEAVHASPGTVVLSCEGFSAVPAEHAQMALGDLDPAGVRVVCTLRDPTRLLPSVWQQHVRTGSTVELATFVAHVRDGLAWEWLPAPLDVVDAWSSGLGPEQLRLVTVPRSTTDPSLLWRRFAAACDLDPDRVTELPPPANTSLPAVQVELLRRVNLALGDRRPTEQQHYRDLVRPVQRSRPAHATVDEPALGPASQAWAVTEARRLVHALRDRDHPVHGDLDELLPGPVDSLTTGPSGVEVPDAEVVSAATALTAGLLLALRSARRDAGTTGGARGRPGHDRRGPRRGQRG